jgi:hypothetical protein
MCRDGTPGRTESPVGCRSADTVNDPRGKAGATIWPNSVGAAQPRLARSSTRLTRERVPPDPAAGRWASVSGIRVAFRLNALPGASRPAGCPGVKLPRAAKVASWPGNLPASLPFPTCFGCERHRGSVGSGVLRIRWGANGGRRRQGALPSPPHRHRRRPNRLDRRRHLVDRPRQGRCLPGAPVGRQGRQALREEAPTPDRHLGRIIVRTS